MVYIKVLKVINSECSTENKYFVDKKIKTGGLTHIISYDNDKDWEKKNPRIENVIMIYKYSKNATDYYFKIGMDGNLIDMDLNVDFDKLFVGC